MVNHGAAVAAGTFIAASTAEVVTGSGGPLDTAIGAVVAIVVALISAFAVIRRTRGRDLSLDDVNAIAIARTTEANFATFRQEMSAWMERQDRLREADAKAAQERDEALRAAVTERQQAIEKWVKDIEDHVRPWPGGRRGYDPPYRPT